MNDSPKNLKRPLQTFPLHLKVGTGGAVPRESYLKERLASFFQNPKLKPYQGNDTHETCSLACDCTPEQKARFEEYASLKQLPIFHEQAKYIENMKNGHVQLEGSSGMMRSLVISKDITHQSPTTQILAAIQFEIDLKNRTLSIFMLGVNEDYQRKGLGHQLLSAALLIGLEYGCKKISLGSSQEGLEFYNHFGFFHQNYDDPSPITDISILQKRLNHNIEFGDYGLEMTLHLRDRPQYQSYLDKLRHALQVYQPTFNPMSYLHERITEYINSSKVDSESPIKRLKEQRSIKR